MLLVKKMHNESFNLSLTVLINTCKGSGLIHGASISLESSSTPARFEDQPLQFLEAPRGFLKYGFAFYT